MRLKETATGLHTHANVSALRTCIPVQLEALSMRDSRRRVDPHRAERRAQRTLSLRQIGSVSEDGTRSVSHARLHASTQRVDDRDVNRRAVVELEQAELANAIERCFHTLDARAHQAHAMRLQSRRHIK